MKMIWNVAIVKSSFQPFDCYKITVWQSTKKQIILLIIQLCYNSLGTIQYYSRVHISSDTAFLKIVKKPSIVQE